MYRHTQRSRTAAVSFAVFAVLLAGLVWTDPVIWPLMLGLTVLLAWACWIFRRMTVEVADGELRAWFGSGWPRYSWPLGRIDAVRTVQNSFWDGTGIRFTRHGLLYNVASGPGIEFRLKSGATFRLGSDEPEALADAIRSAARLDAPDAQRTPARAAH